MHRNALRALIEAIDNREAVALVTVTSGEGAFAQAVGRNAVVRPDLDAGLEVDLGLGTWNAPVLRDARLAVEGKKHKHLNYEQDGGRFSVFVEVQPRPPHLIIAGAGHIAVPLASIAKTCEFLVTVIDDRPQYAHTARFPTADRVVAGPFRQTLVDLRQGKEDLDNDTYVVLVTRGHQYDIDCLLELLDDPLAYLGMIGSRRRIRAVFELLEKEQNIPASKFDRVRAPIGIDIGAITPAEIAVCIMAEIICILREGPLPGLSEQIQQERIERRIRAQASVGERSDG
ncbi:MAG: XdhC family protein [Caldilineaceae bacterium]|nr:XdhC family protein [Caldilineaceae bacterium]MDE0339789.1 XdhC family protein [Caldilineaceae bacterium]